MDPIVPEVEAPVAEEEINPAKPIVLSAEREERLITQVMKNYTDIKSSTSYQKLLKNIEAWHKAYLGQVEPNSWPWKDASNIDLGIMEMCVDNIKSRYKLSTMGARPMFNSVPITPEGEESKDKITDGMNYILDHDIDVAEVIDTVAQKTVEYGTCVGKLYWKKDILETKEYDQIGDVVFPKDKSDVVEMGAVDIIELADLFVPESCPEDIQKAPFVYHRTWYSVYDLEKKVKLGFFSEAKIEQVKAGLISQKEKSAKSPDEIAKMYSTLPEEQVEILECYQRFSVDGKMEKECIFWICPSTKTYMKGFFLKDICFSGKRPFNVWRYKKTGSFYGRGVVEMLMDYRKLMNDSFNYGVNCMMLQVLPWGFYRIGSSFKPEEVKLSPGVMIPIDDINDVKMASFATNAQQMDAIVMLIMSFIERQTGISSPHMGQEFPTRKTATEIKTIISEGNVKHEDRIQMFQNEVSRLFKGIYNLYRQNQGKGKSGRIGAGEDYKFVELFSAFDRLPDYDFIILGTLTTGNKAIEREDTMALYTITGQNPIFAEWPIGQLEMLKEVFNTFGKRNIKRFLPPDDLVKMYQQAKLQALQAKMGMMQQGVSEENASIPMPQPAMGESAPVERQGGNDAE